MVLERVTAADYAQLIANGVNRRDATMDTRIDAVRDLLIDPVSEVFEQQNNRAVYLSNLASLKYANRVLPDDLDDLVYNEGIVRWEGSRSVTTVTFSRVQRPTTDIIIPINFPLATEVDPTTGKVVVFRTVETKTMRAAAADSYFNATTLEYEIEVAVSSVVTGSESAVGAYTITTFRRPFPEFDSVFNTQASTSGKDTETNGELAERYLLHIEGSQLGTPAGIKRTVLDNFSNVEDVYVVYGEDPYLTREQDDAGAIDVWVMAETPATRNYTIAFPGAEITIPLDRQPLIEILSVLDSSGTSYAEGTDYEVVTGEGEWSYSARASDGIKFLSTGTLPSENEPLTITYKYNAMINILESFFTQPEYFNLSQDRLYRWAQARQIEIEADLRVKAGNPETVAEQVRQAVLSYINGLKLGDNVEEFDIDSVVSRVFGVDNWTYSVLSYQDETGISDLEIGPNEFARLDEADLVINLV